MPRTRVKRITVYLDCRMRAGGCLQVGFDRHCQPLGNDERMYTLGEASVGRVQWLLEWLVDPGGEVGEMVEDVDLTTRSMEISFDVCPLQMQSLSEM